MVAAARANGVLLMEVQLEDARVEVLRSTGTPFALIGRSADLTGLVYVDIDFDTTVQQAVDHLHALGHSELAMVTGSQADASYRTYGPYVRAAAAYRRTAAELGLDAHVVECEQTVVAGRAASRAPSEPRRAPRRSARWRTARRRAPLRLGRGSAGPPARRRPCRRGRRRPGSAA